MVKRKKNASLLRSGTWQRCTFSVTWGPWAWGLGRGSGARQVMGRMCPTCITKPHQRLIHECRCHRECFHHPTSALRSTLHFFSSACLLLVLLSITFTTVDFYSLFLWHYLILLSLLFSSFSLLPVFVSFFTS